MAKFKFAEGYAGEDACTEDVGKTSFVPFNPKKGKLSMDCMVESGWQSKDYLAPTRETASLVRKSMGMLGATSGGLLP